MGNVGRKILVVDDNTDFLDFVRRFLESKNFRVFIALNGKTAIETTLTHLPDLALLDLKLPDIPGEEVLKSIKEVDKDLAVIVITGFGGEQVAVDMMRKGAVDFLSKPIDPQVLLSSISNALEIRDAQIEDGGFDRYPSLEKFFPFLAHEIRNPLHAISGALAIIHRRSDLKDELLSQSVKIISEEVSHLNEFVQECLNFVRPPNMIRITGVEINEVISVVMNIISHMFELQSKKVRVITEIDPHLPKVYVNYEEIKQAFLNIVRNAFEAMPEGGQFTIKARRQSDFSKFVEITFVDDGMGIKKENLSKLFNPFFTTKIRGTGLGLAICHRIINERHGGKIHIESKENEGTSIKVELPLGRPLGETPGVK